MKHAQGHGLVLSILLNMLFRSYWLVLIAILIILHFTAGWQIWLIAIPAVLWFLHSLIITLVLGWANSSTGVQTKPEQKNINPYSYKDPDKK